jgi:hypothetical protein
VKALSRIASSLSRSGAVRNQRRAAATRDASLTSNGSGAPSRNTRLAAFVLGVVALAVLAFAPAALANEVVRYIGPELSTGEFGRGSLGGEFNEPRGVGANTTGVGAPMGTTYVADDANNRVERFNAKGKFVSAWGMDVIASTVDERQRLVVSATAGTYTLSFDGSTTAPLNFDASSFSIEQALGGLSSVGGLGNIQVPFIQSTAQGRVIAFEGSLAAADQPQITVDTSQLAGTAKVTTIADGAATTASTGTGFEVCTVAAQCKAGAASGGDGTVAGNGALNRPQAVAVDGDTGWVYVSDRDNSRINVYDAAGSFLFSVGRDVEEPDGGAAVEICGDVGGDVCRQGDGGSGPGEIGSTTTAGTLGIAVSPPDGNAATGTVFLADSQNRRVNTYALDGTSPASFGSSANFGSTQPRHVAVDSRGIVYASDSNIGGEVDRYDSLDANGGGVGFLASIPASVNEVQILHFEGFNNFGDSYSLSCPNGAQTEVVDWFVNGSGPSEAARVLKDACGAENIVLDGSPNEMKVTFVGAFGSTDVPTTSCTIVAAAPGASCFATTEAQGLTSTLNAGSTAGLAVDPDADGAGSDEDILYALRAFSVSGSGSATVQQLGPVNDPGLTAPPTDTDDVHGTGAGFSAAVNGLGLDDSSGRLFVPATGDLAGTGQAHRVYVIGPALPSPSVTMNAVTTKTDSTATLSAIVDPKGGFVRCSFEYSTEIGFADSNEVTAPGCTSFGPDAGSQAVSQVVTGLEPNTRYYARLTVTRTFDPSLVTTSPYKEFFTSSVPPVVTDVGAVQVADTSARMVGTIDPRNSSTGYVFEYGTTPGLGSSTAPLGIGGGATPITVSQVVGGLSPDTTYFFRLVATNAFGSTPSAQKTLHTRVDAPPPANPGNCANEALREEQSSTFLPDCRAYEMVTPTDKNQGGAAGRGGFGGEEYLASVSLDGNAVAFCTASLFGEPPSHMNGACAPYISHRGDGGWSTMYPFPEFCQLDAVNGGQGGATGFLAPQSFDRIAVVVPDLASCPFSPLLPGASFPSPNLYRVDLTADPFGLDLLSPNSTAASPTGPALEPLGGSHDFSHVLYGSYINQTPDSPPQATFLKLYDWEEAGQGGCVQPGGCLELVSVAPDGQPFTTPSGIPGLSRDVATTVLETPVSADGERIYFQNPSDSYGCFNTGCELYLRENGEETIHVSASECTSACGGGSSSALFRWGSESGDKALFLSCAKLTDASSEGKSCSPSSQSPNISEDLKLYRWDRNAVAGHRLVDLTIDGESADGTQPRAVDVIGASSDTAADPDSNAAPGNTVYFVAQSQLVAGEHLTVPGEGDGLKLYRWRWNGGGPSVDYLGRYLPSQYNGEAHSESHLAEEPNADRLHIRVTPDGRYLAIQTKLALDPAGDRDSDADLYRWDEAGGWLCISCQLPGAPSAGHVTGFSPHLAYNSFVFHELGGNVPEHTISDDGKRIFFTTPDALVPEDINGEGGCPGEPPSVAAIPILIYPCQDVYEWHDGTVSLLSSGTGSRAAILIGATADSRDVIFGTPQRLLGWDRDTQPDIYDARVGGGFPEPPPQPPTCEGEACRGQGTAAPGGPGAGTAVFEGPGDQTKPQPKPCKRGFVKRHGKCVKKKRQHKRQRATNNDRRAGR